MHASALSDKRQLILMCDKCLAETCDFHGMTEEEYGVLSRNL
jgi:hypothetical protein